MTQQPLRVNVWEEELWAQALLLAWAGLLLEATLLRVVTVLREKDSGCQGRAGEEQIEDWIATGRTEPYTSLEENMAEEARFL